MALQRDTLVTVTAGRFQNEPGRVVGQTGCFVTVVLDCLPGATVAVLRDEMKVPAERETRRAMWEGSRS